MLLILSFVNSSDVKENQNIDLADFLQNHKFEFEINIGDNYCIAEYLHDMRKSFLCLLVYVRKGSVVRENA